MSLVKIMACAVMLAILGWRAPSVLKPPRPPVFSAAQPLNERVRSNEQQLQDMDRRITVLEVHETQDKVAERLASIEARQESVLMLLVPVALFLLTHTFEVVRRMWKGHDA